MERFLPSPLSMLVSLFWIFERETKLNIKWRELILCFMLRFYRKEQKTRIKYEHKDEFNMFRSLSSPHFEDQKPFIDLLSVWLITDHSITDTNQERSRPSSKLMRVQTALINLFESSSQRLFELASSPYVSFFIFILLYFFIISKC
jgi:hypothetical protein